MAANEAKIRIGIEGTNDIRNALRMVRNEFSGLEGIAKGVASGFVRMGTDIAKAATGLKAIDFGAAVDKYKAVDDQITRLAVRSGKNVDELKNKFREFGRSAGVGTGEFANVAKQFDRATFAGIDDAAEAMASLGAYAEDTDRSLEEMAELGADLYNKIGLPASQVGAELRKIQTIASNSGLASGFLGLEDSVRRLLPLMGKLQGGATRGGATVAALQGQGYGKQAAEEIYSRIFGPLTDEREALIRQAAKSAGFKGDVVVSNPYGPNKGLPQISKGAMKAIQKYVKGKPLLGAGEYFGGGVVGTEAARAFGRLDLDKVDVLEDEANFKEDYEQYRAEQDKAAAEEAAAFAARDKTHRGPGGGSLSGAAGLFGPAKRYSKFGGTEAGKRQRRELARQALESDIGKLGTDSQARLAGKLTTGEAAAAGTVGAYMPGVVQDIGAGAAAAYGNSNEIAGALRGLKDSLDSLPSKVQSGVKAGVESAKPAPRAGIGDIFPEKNKARVN